MHRTPQAPQLSLSVVGSTHAVPQSSFAQGAGVHVLLWQVPPSAQASPQAPQLALLVVVSTQE